LILGFAASASVVVGRSAGTGRVVVAPYPTARVRPCGGRDCRHRAAAAPATHPAAPREFRIRATPPPGDTRLFWSEVRGQGLFRRSRAAGTRPGGWPSGSRTPHRHPRSPRYHQPQASARCRAGATTTMEHRGGSDNGNAPSSWSAGRGRGAPSEESHAWRIVERVTLCHDELCGFSGLMSGSEPVPKATG
jgi:hypothetical protein